MSSKFHESPDPEPQDPEPQGSEPLEPESQEADPRNQLAPARARRMPRVQRREQLFERALEVFVSQGYHVASMENIAEAAQVSKPVLYQHFSGKHELFLAVFNAHLEVLQERLTTAVIEGETNKARVYATVRTFYEFIAGSPESYQLIFASGMDHDAAVSQRLERFHSQVVAAIADVIVDDTGHTMAEATMLGHGLIGMATSAAHHWSLLSERPDIDVSATVTARLAWRGISGFPREDHH